MHNLSTVVNFEIIRTLKKKSFWIMALAFPVIISAVFAVVFFANKATEQAVKDTEKQKFSIQVYDPAGLVKPEILSAISAQTITDKQTGIDNVRTGRVTAFFYYPGDVTKNQVEVYGKDVGLFDNSRYNAVAKSLLDQSTASTVSGSARAILQNTVTYKSTTYKDGEVFDGIKQLIAPGIFLILFYALIAMFGNQMLSSTTEEKENRVIEMLLTTVESRTLITGKILSLVVLGILQMFIIIIPIITIYLLFGDKLSLPNFDLSNLPLDWARIALGFIIFMISFLLFTGLLVTVGSATPTAKEASGFFGVVVMLIFGPLYASPLFVSAPESPLVQFLSYFPFTAPIPLLLRNAVGNLDYGSAFLAIVILSVTAVVVLNIAVRVFRYGALQYSRKLSFKEIFARH